MVFWIGLWESSILKVCGTKIAAGSQGQKCMPIVLVVHK